MEKIEDGKCIKISSLQEIIFDLDMTELLLRRCRTQNNEPREGLYDPSSFPPSPPNSSYDPLKSSAQRRANGIRPSSQALDSTFVQAVQILPETEEEGSSLEAVLARVNEARRVLQRRAQEAHSALAARSEAIKGDIARMRHLLDLADSCVASTVEQESKKVLDKLLTKDLGLKTEQSRLLLKLEAGRVGGSLKEDRKYTEADSQVESAAAEGEDPERDNVAALDEFAALAGSSLDKLDQVLHCANPW